MKRLAAFSVIFMLLLLSCGDAALEIEHVADSGDTVSVSDTDASPEVDFTDINGYYLSLTTAFVNDEGYLCEGYATYDFASREIKTHMTTETTADYPCGVYDSARDRLYFISTETYYWGEKQIWRNLLFENDFESETISKLSDVGLFARKMIPLHDGIYMITDTTSGLQIKFACYDLQTGEIRFLETQAEGKPTMTDLEYHASKDAFVLSWYSYEEQSALYREFYDRQKQGIKENYPEIADNFIDLVDREGRLIRRIAVVEGIEVEEASVSLDESTVVVGGYREKAETPIVMLLRDGEWRELEGINVNSLLLSPDGKSLYFKQNRSEDDTGLHVYSVLCRYDIDSGEITEEAVFDAKVVDMVMLRK